MREDVRRFRVEGVNNDSFQPCAKAVDVEVVKKVAEASPRAEQNSVRLDCLTPGFIVNLASVKEMQPLFHGEYVVIMKDGAKLTLSRSRREKLRALLGAAF